MVSCTCVWKACKRQKLSVTWPNAFRVNAAERDSADPPHICLSAAAELVGTVSAALECGCSGTPAWPARWGLHDLPAVVVFCIGFNCHATAHARHHTVA